MTTLWSDLTSNQSNRRILLHDHNTERWLAALLVNQIRHSLRACRWSFGWKWRMRFRPIYKDSPSLNTANCILWFTVQITSLQDGTTGYKTRITNRSKQSMLSKHEKGWRVPFYPITLCNNKTLCITENHFGMKPSVFYPQKPSHSVSIKFDI